MINLIRNEITKIFKKKGIYITLIVTLLFVILVNVVCKYGEKLSMSYSDSTYKTYIEAELAKLDPNTISDNAQYIMLKTDLDIINLQDKYGQGSWQYFVVEQKMRSIINAYNEYKYGLNAENTSTENHLSIEDVSSEYQPNIQNLQEAETEYNRYIEILDSNNWRYFAEEDLKQIEEEIKNVKELKTNTEDLVTINELENKIYDLNLQKQVLDWRLEKDIGYNDKKNSSLQQYYYYQSSIYRYENDKNEKTYKDKTEHQEDLERASTIKYAIDNNIQISDGDDNKGILENLFSNYELFIIIIIVMIAGSIVSEEFAKGTIKLLLIKPYSRIKILLAKYITTLFTIIFASIAVILMQTVVGGILFGFNDLSIPTLVYNFTTNSVMEMNIFAYVGILLLHKLPLYILIATLAFAFSTIFTNTPVAITISLLGYMSTSIINALVSSFNIKFMRFFITQNWDLTQYLFGRLPNTENINFGFSLMICLVYFIIMIVPTFVVFKKKNIKNV